MTGLSARGDSHGSRNPALTEGFTAPTARQFVFTRDGYASVQVMYRNLTGGDAGPVQYAQGGYEASYGRYDVDEPAHAWTLHGEGAMVRSLVGKDLKRRYEFSGNQLIVTPSSADEHWRVAWERQ